jgi:pimeloyl-ACP methyl ester carboxylesterase
VRDLGAGAALLLVHGGFSDGPGAWAAQMESLPAHHRLLVPDRRGHGRSPVDPRPYTVHGDALDVLEAADHAGEFAFHLAGHSYGGLVALEAALLAPHRILSLHLVEPPYLSVLPDAPDVRALDSAVRALVEAGRERGGEWTAAQFFRALAGAEAAERLRSSSRWPAIAREGGRILEEQPAGDYPPDRVGRLRLGVPVQLYTGGQSHPALRRVARRLAELIPAAPLVELPGASHAAQAAGEPFDQELLSITLPR